METNCAFCSEPTDDIIQVTDLDGIKYPMCRECLEHPDSDVMCQCGSVNFKKQTNGMIWCDGCYSLIKENNFYHLNWSMRKSQENYKQSRIDYKKDSELCDIVFKLIRAEFDKVGTTTPFHPYHAVELLKLTQAAKKLVIGRAGISGDEVKQMEIDINI